MDNTHIPTIRRSRGAVLLALIILLGLVLAGPAWADLSEFETWRLDRLEADDEAALDNFHFAYNRFWQEA